MDDFIKVLMVLVLLLLVGFVCGNQYCTKRNILEYMQVYGEEEIEGYKPVKKIIHLNRNIFSPTKFKVEHVDGTTMIYELETWMLGDYEIKKKKKKKKA